MINTDGHDVSKYVFELEVTILDPGQKDTDVRNAINRVLELMEMKGFFTLKIKEDRCDNCGRVVLDCYCRG